MIGCRSLQPISSAAASFGGGHKMITIFTGPGHSVYEIENSRVQFGQLHPKGTHLYLDVSLKSYPVQRYTQEHVARLHIDFHDFKQMVETLTSQLEACYRVLYEKDLLNNVTEAMNKQQEDKG
jgi:hypothetical protein